MIWQRAGWIQRLTADAMLAAMQIGFAPPVSGSWATAPNLARIARRADELGYHSLWTIQRLLYPADDSGRWVTAYRTVLDPLVSLGHIAALTRNIRLGIAVLNMPFFSPALLGKQLTTVDIVSEGRLDVGLGLGWAPGEFTASGVPYERRGKRGEDFLKALKALWTEDPAEYHGEFYEIPPSHQDPKPVQRPHPPIYLGGEAPAALRRAGRMTDGWVSASRHDLTTIEDSIELVREGAREAGRDPSTLRFVSRGVVRVRPGGDPDRRPLTGSLDEIRADLGQLAAKGISEVFVDLNFDPEIANLEADTAESMRRAEAVLEALAPGS
jgi:probable F420-dependent oxidoreductase